MKQITNNTFYNVYEKKNSSAMFASLPNYYIGTEEWKDMIKFPYRMKELALEINDKLNSDLNNLLNENECAVCGKQQEYEEIKKGTCSHCASTHPISSMDNEYFKSYFKQL